jgi:hypothetical protein
MAAAIMQMLPVIISAIGAASQKGGLFGSNAEKGSTYTKGQQGLIDEVLGLVKGNLGGGQGDITQNQNYQTGQDWLQSLFNDPNFFQSFEAPLQRQFQEETVPGLANRFASMGSGGALGSTAFRNQLGREGSNLSTNIAALRGGMQQQAIPQLQAYGQQPISNIMQYIQQALTPTQNTYQGASTGLFGGAASGFMSGAAQGYGQKWGESMVPGQSPSTTQNPVP